MTVNSNAYHETGNLRIDCLKVDESFLAQIHGAKTRKTFANPLHRQTAAYRAGIHNTVQKRQTETGTKQKDEKTRGGEVGTEIQGVSDVICSTRQESVICSTEGADFIRQNRAGQDRATLWLVSAQQRHS